MEKNALCQEIAPNVDRGTGTGIKVRNGLIEHSSGMWIPLKKICCQTLVFYRLYYRP
ncbi:MAG: hypothetical protein WBP88_10095 [Nitrososphaeraceae archaeon]